jgi:hypothetical protein
MHFTYKIISINGIFKLVNEIYSHEYDPYETKELKCYVISSIRDFLHFQIVNQRKIILKS